MEAVLGEKHTRDDAAAFLVACIGNTFRTIQDKHPSVRSTHENQVLAALTRICGNPSNIYHLKKDIYAHFGIVMPARTHTTVAFPNGKRNQTPQNDTEIKYPIEREDYHSNIRQMMNEFLDILAEAKLDSLTSRQVEFLLRTPWFGIKRAIDNRWITPLRKNAPGTNFSGSKDDHGIYSVYEAAFVSYVARKYRNLTERKVREVHEVLKEEIQKRIDAEQEYWKGLSRNSLRGMF